MTHCRSFSATLRAVLIDGSATLTIETSSTVMNIATQTSASACQRRGSGAWAADSIVLLRLVFGNLLSERKLLVGGRAQHVLHVGRDRRLQPDVPTRLLGQKPAVLEQLVEDLGGGAPAPQLGRDRGDRGLEDLAEPAPCRSDVRHWRLAGALEPRLVPRQVVQQTTCLVLLRVEAREPQQPAAVVTRLDNLGVQ